MQPSGNLKLAIHCAAMQGRLDALERLCKFDAEEQSQQALINDGEHTNPPTPIYMSVANTHLDCAEWLVVQGFAFKERELGALMSTFPVRRFSARSDSCWRIEPTKMSSTLVTTRPCAWQPTRRSCVKRCICCQPE